MKKNTNTQGTRNTRTNGGSTMMYTVKEIKELMDMGFSKDEILAMCKGTQGAPKHTGKAKVSAEKVEYTKDDGTTTWGTPAQIKAWDAFKSRKRMSLDEVKEITFDGNFTDAHKAWIIAHPICTCKEFKEANKDARGCTKDQLKTYKATLRAQGLMK